MRKILITGASGQIGSNLVERLSALQHTEVIATDLHEPNFAVAQENLVLDVTDKQRLFELVKQYNINEIYHLGALLSAVGEKKPNLAWSVNMDGLRYVLEAAREFSIKVFWPSSIAVFGTNSPKFNTPQHTITEPSTMYGLTKVSGELLCKYYHEHFNVDVRSVRFPGLISWQGEPGGGTTDYAVDIYHHAVQEKNYTSFLLENSYLPMLYMNDALDGILKLMNADSAQLTIRTSYNMNGMSFAPKEITAEIQKHYPLFKVSYKPDFRQDIANSWINSMDDASARADWNWNPKYNLETMTNEMIYQLKKVYN